MKFISCNIISNMNIIISFCYDPTYKPLIANYENNRNTVMSYLKREGISDVLKDESIIKYMKQITALIKLKQDIILMKRKKFLFFKIPL